MQREILEKNPNAKLKVYAVWFNMLASDDRSRWPQDLFSDPRVVEYWDDRQVLGTWYAGHPDYEDYPGPVLWDAYLHRPNAGAAAERPVWDLGQ